MEREQALPRATSEGVEAAKGGGKRWNVYRHCPEGLGKRWNVNRHCPERLGRGRRQQKGVAKGGT